MFEAEATALRELAAANAVKVPAVLGLGTTSSQAFLALEWIELRSADASSDARLGEQLAWQHRATARRFGWHHDNTIGSTPQENEWDDDWARFFRKRRLEFQLDLAERSGAQHRLVERGRWLCEHVGGLFYSYTPAPSLLHGDLWSGNRAMDVDGRPVIFDPATYYGDREADIAMTRLFGGLSSTFYTAYHATWPLDQAAGTRRTLYNLYHVLNHFNLFGGGYASQAEGMIDRLLAELGH
jgi:fructosamine-3-kinase